MWRVRFARIAAPATQTRFDVASRAPVEPLVRVDLNEQAYAWVL